MCLCVYFLADPLPLFQFESANLVILTTVGRDANELRGAWGFVSPFGERVCEKKIFFVNVEGHFGL